VVDLGTAFGLDVKPGGPEVHAEVHVFKGEVELHPAKPGQGGSHPAEPGQAVQGLKQGEAAAVERDGTLRRFAADAGAFTTVTGLERRAAQALGRRYDAWRSAGTAWNAEPSLLARFDFENLKAEDRTLRNCPGPPRPLPFSAPRLSAAGGPTGGGRGKAHWSFAPSPTASAWRCPTSCSRVPSSPRCASTGWTGGSTR
jgi:hypothetical protein